MPESPTRIALFGATGRMGRALIAAIAAETDLELAGALVRRGSPLTGSDAGALAGVPSIDIALTDDRLECLSNADVAIDFTSPDATSDNVAACVEAGCAMVIGTTGIESDVFNRLVSAAGKVPVVFGANMSIGMNLVFELSRKAAQALGDSFDVEIIEMHHRGKVDAPSGSALQLGRTVADALGRELDTSAEFTRHGQAGPRGEDAIGFAVVRAGSLAGEHTALFAGPHERIEITHRAANRAAFADGALRAARWIGGRSPGIYGMADVLGLG